MRLKTDVKINYRKTRFFHSSAIVTNLEGITLIGIEQLTKKAIHKALYQLKKLRGLSLHHRVIINNDVVFFSMQELRPLQENVI